MLAVNGNHLVGWSKHHVRQRTNPFHPASYQIVPRKNKALRIFGGAPWVKNPLIHHNIFRVAVADQPLGIGEAVYVNSSPATVHKDEVGVADQSEMPISVALDEEVFRVPPE